MNRGNFVRAPYPSLACQLARRKRTLLRSHSSEAGRTTRNDRPWAATNVCGEARLRNNRGNQTGPRQFELPPLNLRRGLPRFIMNFVPLVHIRVRLVELGEAALAVTAQGTGRVPKPRQRPTHLCFVHTARGRYAFPPGPLNPPHAPLRGI